MKAPVPTTPGRSSDPILLEVFHLDCTRKVQTVPFRSAKTPSISRSTRLHSGRVTSATSMGQLEIRIPTKAKSKKPWTKPPFQVNGNYAKSTDPRTWTSFEEALLHIGNFDGIGFAPTEEDPYALIDLDNCRDPQTGEITAWGQKIIQQAMSYTEVSPTGTGIRIIAKGTLPPEGRKKGDIEIYNTGHYLTLTGHHVVGTPLKIHERQSEIQAIHTDVFGPRNQNGKNPAGNTSPQLSDGEILDRAFSAKNSAKIRQLYLLGDTSGYNSSSEADLALCDLLVFYTGTDLAQLDRLFRGSKLFRSEKWDAKHYADGRTYGQGVTDKALEGKTDFYSPNGTGASAHTKGKRDQSEPLGSDPDAEEVRLHIIPIRCEKAVN